MASTNSEEDVYDVERIVDDRIYRGKKQYLIKWVGYPDSDNTWEFKSNLFCTEMLNEYDKKKTEKSKPNQSKTTKEAAEKKPESNPPAPETSERTDAAPTKINYEDIKKLVKPLPKAKFEQRITNEWHLYIDRIVGAYSTESQALEVEFLTVDGKIATCPASVMRFKAPLKLLDFYESNLAFPE